MDRPKYSDPWEAHKDDWAVWRRFWALIELRRKWKWADTCLQKVDRCDGDIVEPTAWGFSESESYMQLCLWIAMLRSVHEGLTQTLDPLRTPATERVAVAAVFPDVPATIKTFPQTKSAKDFRDVVFHCQWKHVDPRLNLDNPVTQQLETLHAEIGQWLATSLRSTYELFIVNYETPEYWLLSPDYSDLF
jgi:hypothetical protein